MFQANEAKVLSLIGPQDVVLDIGGWARCFNRANYVMDLHPYEGHGSHYQKHLGLGPQGGPIEHFTAETWIRRDLCDRTPFPFADKSIDFCICSHTLEDLRDPIWICSEMRRVAKRGYIEVPSLLFEMSRGREPGVPVGLSHHRWICEVEGSRISFSPKNHYIHGDPKLSLSASFGGSLPEDQLVSWLFWEGDFSFREGWLTAEHMQEIVRRHDPLEARTEAPAADALELDRLRLLIAYSQRQLDERSAQADALQARADALQARADALQARLATYEDLGPRALAVARRAKRLARRFPYVSSLIRTSGRVA